MILMMADSGAASGCGGWRVCKKILFQNLSQVVLSRATAMGKMGGLGSDTRRTDKTGWYWQSNARKSYSVVDIRSINFGVAVDAGTVQSDLVPWPTQIDRPDFFLLIFDRSQKLNRPGKKGTAMISRAISVFRASWQWGLRPNALPQMDQLTSILSVYMP